MRILGVLILILPLNVLAVDNLMINSEVKEIQFQKEPIMGMAFTPGIEPGVVISPPEGQSSVIPGYRFRYKGMAVIVGVSCKADLKDDCSAYPYREDYESRPVYVRYIQTSDAKFKTPEGSSRGDRWDRTIQRVGDHPLVYSAMDSCVRLPSGWRACIDLMSANRSFDPKLRRLMPKNTATIDFFYKDQTKK